MRPSNWLGQGWLLAAALVIGLVAADQRPAQAQGTSNAPGVEELQREIEQLRRRLETLEQKAAAIVAAPAPPAVAQPALPQDPQPALSQAAPPAEADEREDMAAPAEIGAIRATEEDIERALERALVQTGVMVLPAGSLEIDPYFSYSRQERGTPVFFTEGGEQSLAGARSNNLEAGLSLRLGLPLESQLQIGLPYRYRDDSTLTRVSSSAVREESQHRSGFGDVAVTFSKALLREGDWWPNLFANVQWDTDTGETKGGIPLGSGFHELSASLSASKRQDPLVFVGGVSYSKSFEKNGIDPGDGIGLVIGTHLAASPQTSLRFFLAQSFADELKVNNQEIEGTDQVSTSLILGASTIIGPRLLFDVAVGIGLTENAPDYSVTVSLPFRF